MTGSTGNATVEPHGSPRSCCPRRWARPTAIATERSRKCRAEALEVPGPQLGHLAGLIEAQRLLEFDPAAN